MPISDWPRFERPREKLIKLGPAALSDAELLAIFLRTGHRGVSALDLARHMLGRFGGIRGLIDAEPEEVLDCQGIGPAKYVQLRATIELSQRYLWEEMSRRSIISDPSHTKSYVKSKLRHRSREVFACLYLDNQHRVIAFEELFFGTIDGASVHPREVLKSALRHNAAAVIFTHNHPSGVAEPSQADIRITDRLKSALQLVDIRVLDHMIVGEGEVFSFAEKGLL